MEKLKHITFQQFRGLQGLTLTDLGQINLLVGTNNSGKTSVLEALAIYCHPLDIRAWWTTSFQRDQEDRFMRAYSSPLDSIRWLFPHFDTLATTEDETETGTIIIHSEGNSPIHYLESNYEIIEGLRVSRKRGREDNQNLEDLAEIQTGLDLKIKVRPTSPTDHLDRNEISVQIWENEPFFKLPRSSYYNMPVETVTLASHLSESSQFRLLAEARFQNFKSDVVTLLKSIDNQIEDLEIWPSPRSTSNRDIFNLYIVHHTLGLAPLSSFGDGIRRLLHIALKLVRAKGGILLIDELESAIHTEALQNAYGWITQWCKELDVQLFATTHSLETVDALLEVTESQTDLVLHRLEAGNGKPNVVRHDWNRLKILREELGQEVRW